MAHRYIRCLDGNRRPHQQRAFTATDCALVVAAAIGEPGYVIIHKATGAGILRREELADAKRALEQLLVSDIDFEAPIGLDYTEEHTDLQRRCKEIIGEPLWPNLKEGQS